MSRDNQWARGPGAQHGRPRPSQTALATVSVELARRTGTFESVDALREALDGLSEHANLLLPVQRVGLIPQGHAVTVAAHAVDVENETYPVKGGRGKRALHKAALDKIGAAAGLTWGMSRREDNGAHPHVCEIVVVCEVQDLDGKSRRIEARKRLDLRDDAPMALEILANAETAEKGARQLRQTRAFITEHTESKARNRAVRLALGLRQAYTAQELSRPFVAAKMVWTGNYGDPATNRAVALLSAAKALGAGAELFAHVGAAMFGAGRPELDDALDAPEPPQVLDVLDDDAPDDVLDDEPEAGDDFGEIRAGLKAKAARKGRLAPSSMPGDAAHAAGMITSEQIDRLDPDHLARLDNKLSAMPDDEPEGGPEPLDLSDELPTWMKD